MASVQNVIVFVLVTASVLMSAWWLTPARQRLWLLERVVKADATRGALVALRRKLLARAALGSCGACKANLSAGAQRSTQKAAAPRR